MFTLFEKMLFGSVWLLGTVLVSVIGAFILHYFEVINLVTLLNI